MTRPPSKVLVIGSGAQRLRPAKCHSRAKRRISRCLRRTEGPRWSWYDHQTPKSPRHRVGGPASSASQMPLLGEAKNLTLSASHGGTEVELV